MNDLNTKQLLYYQRFSFFWVRAACKQDGQVMAPNMHHSLLLEHALHMHILNPPPADTDITGLRPAVCATVSPTHIGCGRSAYWMTALQSETLFLVWFRVAWEIQLESYRGGPDMHQLFSGTTMSCNILPIHAHIAIWWTTTHDNKTHVAYHCTTHQMAALPPTLHRFYKNKIG